MAYLPLLSGASQRHAGHAGAAWLNTVAAGARRHKNSSRCCTHHPGLRDGKLAAVRLKRSMSQTIQYSGGQIFIIDIIEAGLSW